MNTPTNAACRRTWRRIQAHITVRRSTLVGARLRDLVGATGDIASIRPDALTTKFAGHDTTEAIRLLNLAIHIRERYSHRL